MADKDVRGKQGGEVGDLFGIVHHLGVFFHCMDFMFIYYPMIEYFLDFECACLLLRMFVFSWQFHKIESYLPPSSVLVVLRAPQI